MSIEDYGKTGVCSVDHDDSLWPLNNGQRLQGEQWILLNRRVALLAHCMKRLDTFNFVKDDLETIINACESEEKKARGIR
jgi:hypothetical protein